jgi:hypothetical protein
MSIFLSRVIALSNNEKQKGIEGLSNVCGVYTISELNDILSIHNKKTYYEHIANKSKLRLVIDYDNPNILSIREIKYLFIKYFYKFITKFVDISYNVYKQGIAISKSNNNQTKLHIIYSNIVLNVDDLIYFMKTEFKNFVGTIKNELLKSQYDWIDYSIYKNNFNLRLVYSPKPNKLDQLIPILNNNILDHLVTYYHLKYCTLKI